MTESSNAPTDRVRVLSSNEESVRRSEEARRLVGLVLVSHSSKLAAGLRELLDPLGGGLVRVETAGGSEDGTAEGGLGTSYERIEAAVAAADAGAGVLLLPDLGSSVLTARLVLADLGRANAQLVDAPFVEGGVAAVVAASTGASLADVAAAAREARTVPKF
ncbi:PTS hybrid protein [Streptacidiphilus sp. MAP12-20]|uniref:PTS-dependent dihydroxyacetone kinase phosphotransferase subunit DhaM n=1 Tax=Streptacidiphilus sp. MAP12-20 TaxID=3156299 RepID=UPI00351355B0